MIAFLDLFEGKVMKKLTLAAAAALLVCAPVSAQTIAGLFNTGTDSNNLALVGGDGVTDPHYLIAASTSPGFAGNQAVTYFNSAYAANDANSRWISISGTGNPGSNTTTYRLTFDLTGFDFLSALITGNWGVDNTGAILLNGSATSNTLPVFTAGNFSSLHAFSVNSGFVAGINTLDFVVTDLGAPTALRVDDISGTATLLAANGAVPEPGTWAMMLLGFGAIGFSMRHRRRTQLSHA